MRAFWGICNLLHTDEGRRLNLPTRVLRDCAGATAIEYGLIAALIAVASVVVMGTVGTNLSDTFATVASSL
jgi:pilus assembly protein Flp/PilA